MGYLADSTESQAIMAVSPARIAAFQVLQEVESNARAQAAEALAHYARTYHLSDEDTRLARTLVFGVLRYTPALDYFYAPLLKQPPRKLDSKLRMLLRMATYQHFYLSKIPGYAIVNDTAELARRAGLKTPQVGFLNAVLRKLVAAAEPPPLPTGNRIGDLAVRHALPESYVRLLVDLYGTHKAADIMAALKDEPKLTLRVNLLVTSTAALSAALAEKGFAVEPAALAADSLVVVSAPPGASLFETEEFNRGEFYVQDEASQAVAHIADPKPGETILDLCAAPGGKTTHMAELAAGKANITATDISADRLHLVEENLQRLQTPNVRVTTPEDALAEDRQYDVILVDAPCSGAGTVRRNPEIAARLTPETLTHYAARQLEVLNSAAGNVGPGGRIVYSTCSVTRQENANVIQQFLKTHPEFIIMRAENESANQRESPWSTLRAADGFYQTWPGHPEIDGFEAVVLGKREMGDTVD